MTVVDVVEVVAAVASATVVDVVVDVAAVASATGAAVVEVVAAVSGRVPSLSSRARRRRSKLAVRLLSPAICPTCLVCSCPPSCFYDVVRAVSCSVLVPSLSYAWT